MSTDEKLPTPETIPFTIIDQDGPNLRGVAHVEGADLYFPRLTIVDTVPLIIGGQTAIIAPDGTVSEPENL